MDVLNSNSNNTDKVDVIVRNLKLSFFKGSQFNFKVILIFKLF